jgi:hypothetical protein
VVEKQAIQAGTSYAKATIRRNEVSPLAYNEEVTALLCKRWEDRKAKVCLPPSERSTERRTMDTSQILMATFRKQVPGGLFKRKYYELTMIDPGLPSIVNVINTRMQCIWMMHDDG